VKCRWLLGDLDSLITRLRSTAQQEQLYPSPTSRLRSCSEFLRFFGRDLHYDVLSMSDPGPGWQEFRQYVPLNLGLLLSPGSAVNAGEKLA